jgi:asparagine synthase (glutamine-hydrolysing)
MESFTHVWEHLPAFARRTLTSAFTLLAPDSDQSRKLAALASGNGRVLHPYFLSRMLFTQEKRDGLISSGNVHAIERSQHSLRENLSRARDLDAINRVSYLEARCYMLNTLLRDSDAMSMAHGLEVRVPLIDHRLAQKLLALPGSWKVDRHTPKPLLVGALHGTLPDQIVHRRKRGFTLPFEHWLREELRSEVEVALGRIGQGPLASVLDPRVVSQIWQDFQQDKTSWSRPWSLYVLQRWCELHSVSA